MRMFKVVVNGSEYEVAVEEIMARSLAAPAPIAIPAVPAPAAALASMPPAAAPAKPKPNAEPAPEGAAKILSPMPGNIIDIDVNLGDKVVFGQKLMILEAMKMQNEIVATRDGVVSEIRVTSGALVDTGDVLAILS